MIPCCKLFFFTAVKSLSNIKFDEQNSGSNWKFIEFISNFFFKFKRI
jgi:hypothetical protein